MALPGRAWLLALVFAWALLLGAGTGRAQMRGTRTTRPRTTPAVEAEEDDGLFELNGTLVLPNGELAPSPPATPAPDTTREKRDGEAEDGRRATSTPPGKPGRTPRPSRGPPRERKWMLCEHEVMSAAYAEPLHVHCGVVDGGGNNTRLELWFQRVGRLRAAGGDEEEGVRNPFPRAAPALLLVLENGTVAHRNADLAAAYVFPPAPADPRHLPLTVRALTAATEGVYTWRRAANGTGKSQRKTVTLTTHREPAVSVEPRPALEGAGYAALCRAADYYPPRSTRLRWFRDGRPVEPRRAREAFAANATSGLFSRTSLLELEGAPGARAPSLRCEVAWAPRDGAERRLSAAATPAVYRAPELSLRFEGGEAVCEARCVPDDERVRLRWSARDGAEEPAPQRTERDGLCAERPGLVNLRGVRLLSPADGPVEYTCAVVGYPEPLPEFSVSATFDASPGAAAGPVVVSVVAVACGLGAAGLLALLAALCVRRWRSRAPRGRWDRL
ncbi:envelope glycoprotein C [Cervid alphaherpesvirus 2]|uniref:Glycoprotein C n=1 Tax=Cervid alphaherpesvirus 2 TaxID=365327 RepID=Q2LDY6_9ALPH|nr:envelope glycoprotein C [Cervid alphaherpesvirus 2]ABC59435.1 glycoprotein C [Cervid alphaherpesvirus 2]AVT50735.1 envelope glycoprotein C [Cervid alphaherpesvirus 2]